MAAHFCALAGIALRRANARRAVTMRGSCAHWSKSTSLRGIHSTVWGLVCAASAIRRIAPAPCGAIRISQQQDARMALAVRIGFAFAHNGFELPAFFATQSGGMLFLRRHFQLYKTFVSTVGQALSRIFRADADRICQDWRISDKRIRGKLGS